MAPLGLRGLVFLPAPGYLCPDARGGNRLQSLRTPPHVSGIKG